MLTNQEIFDHGRRECAARRPGVEEARKLLRDGAAFLEAHKWTTETLARDVEGERCSPLAPEAVRFCAWGAMDKVRMTFDRLHCAPEYSFVRKLFAHANDGKAGSDFNDYVATSKAQVVEAMRAFQRARI